MKTFREKQQRLLQDFLCHKITIDQYVAFNTILVNEENNKMRSSVLNKEEQRKWQNAMCDATNYPEKNTVVANAMRKYQKAYNKLQQMKREIFDKYLNKSN